MNSPTLADLKKCYTLIYKHSKEIAQLVRKEIEKEETRLSRRSSRKDAYSFRKRLRL